MENKLNIQPTQHKFDCPVEPPLTCRERVELQYTAHFIPFLKHLEKSIGREGVIQYLQELAYPGVAEFAEGLVQATGKNDLSVIKGVYNPANPALANTLTMEVLEDTPETYVVNVTECLLAEVFRKAGTADYGYAYLCLDVLLTQLINPQIDLELEGTIMEGYPSCLHRWYTKP